MDCEKAVKDAREAEKAAEQKVKEMEKKMDDAADAHQKLMDDERHKVYEKEKVITVP